MSALGDFIETNAEEILQPYLDLVKQRVSRYGQADPETFPANTRRMIRLLVPAAENPDDDEVQAFVEELVRERLPTGFQLTDILEAMCLYQEIIIPMVWDKVDDSEQRKAVVVQLSEAVKNVGMRFAKDFVEFQMNLLDQQRQAVLELSTPVIKVWDGILALPLVGTIDTYRARQIMEHLLDAIASERASIILIDITGVPVVDTNVADHLIKTIRAAELLGTECLLVGIGPELAQTIVSLGVDLRSITSTADMRKGLTVAFRHLGLKVVKDGV